MRETDDRECTAATAPEHQPGETCHAGNRDRDGGVLLFFFVLGVTASLVIGWGLFPKLLYSRKQQPVEFSHALHAAQAPEGCGTCHYFRQDGSFSGIPTLATCRTCHEEAIGETNAETFFMTEYVYKNREVPWHVYSRQPACVFFSHSAHVTLGQVSCETCHGPIGAAEAPRIYEENRITGYSRDVEGKNLAGTRWDTWDRMKMDDCARCHGALKGRMASVQTQKDGCFLCHK